MRKRGYEEKSRGAEPILPDNASSGEKTSRTKDNEAGTTESTTQCLVERTIRANGRCKDESDRCAFVLVWY